MSRSPRWSPRQFRHPDLARPGTVVVSPSSMPDAHPPFRIAMSATALRYIPGISKLESRPQAPALTRLPTTIRQPGFRLPSWGRILSPAEALHGGSYVRYKGTGSQDSWGKTIVRIPEYGDSRSELASIAITNWVR